jgi:hypothetical protein
MLSRQVTNQSASKQCIWHHHASTSVHADDGHRSEEQQLYGTGRRGAAFFDGKREHLMTPHHFTRPIVWIHGDCLSPYGPALTAYPGAPAIWVWDDALLEEWRISLKRIVFIYECLLDLPVVIRRGDVATESSGIRPRARCRWHRNRFESQPALPRDLQPSAQ